jgi:hypothetical protein
MRSSNRKTGQTAKEMRPDVESLQLAARLSSAACCRMSGQLSPNRAERMYGGAQNGRCARKIIETRFDANGLRPYP